MNIEQIRSSVIGGQVLDQPARRSIRRMGNHTVTDTRSNLVRAILLNGEDLDRIENEPESPPANDRVLSAISRAMDSMLEDDIGEHDKALRLGAIVRIPWMDIDTLAKLRDDVPNSMWGDAARLHRFGETRSERERFISLLDEGTALQLKFEGIPEDVAEAWNQHFLGRRDVHLLRDMGPEAKWSNLDHLVDYYGPSSDTRVLEWLEQNGATASTLLMHLLETDQATITSPDKINAMLNRCSDDDPLSAMISHWANLDAFRVPPCMRRWNDGVLMRRDVASTIP